MGYVPLATLAEELGMDRSNLRKYVLKQDIAPTMVRTEESRSQRTLAVTDEEADSIRRLRESEGFAETGRPASGPILPGGVMLLTDGSHPKRRIRQWIRELIEGVPEVTLPDVTDKVIDLIGQDRELMRAMLYPGVYDEVAHFAARTRGFYLAGETVYNEEGLAAKAHKLKSRWERWLEHAGDRHIRLMAMTKIDLLAAAKERRGRAATEVAIAKLWEHLAHGLDDTQTVADVYTPDQIDAINMIVNDGGIIPPTEG